jgi:hypothetical protein
MNDLLKDARNILTEMEGWNSGDQDCYEQYGEVPFDGMFVFSARNKKIKELVKIIEKLENSAL